MHCCGPGLEPKRWPWHVEATRKKFPNISALSQAHFLILVSHWLNSVRSQPDRVVGKWSPQGSALQDTEQKAGQDAGRWAEGRLFQFFLSPLFRLWRSTQLIGTWLGSEVWLRESGEWSLPLGSLKKSGFFPVIFKDNMALWLWYKDITRKIWYWPWDS